MKGNASLISRYLTLRAAVHRPTPSASVTTSRMKSGSKRRFAVRPTLEYIIATINGTNATVKSTRVEPTAAAGTSRRGKYTLVIRLELFTTLLPAELIAEEKNVHITRPA